MTTLAESVSSPPCFGHDIAGNSGRGGQHDHNGHQFTASEAIWIANGKIAAGMATSFKKAAANVGRSSGGLHGLKGSAQYQQRQRGGGGCNVTNGLAENGGPWESCKAPYHTGGDAEYDGIGDNTLQQFFLPVPDQIFPSAEVTVRMMNGVDVKQWHCGYDHHWCHTGRVHRCFPQRR